MAELSIDSDAAVFIDLEGCLIESWFDRTIIPELKPVIDKLPKEEKSRAIRNMDDYKRRVKNGTYYEK